MKAWHLGVLLLTCIAIEEANGFRTMITSKDRNIGRRMGGYGLKEAMKASKWNNDVKDCSGSEVQLKDEGYVWNEGIQLLKQGILCVVIAIMIMSGVASPSMAMERPESVTMTGNSVVVEVWNLIDKYYIDRSFNGQDWNTILTKYSGVPEQDGMRAATEMVKSLGDKYSRILDSEAYANIQKYDLIGVGATFMPDENRDIMVGAPPVKGSAADQAGIKYGDYITAVNGVSTKQRTSFDIIDQINRDPNAKTITLTVKTPSTNNERDLTLKRTFQKVKNPVSYKITSNGVGYIRISEFNSLLNRYLQAALIDLNQQNVHNYVIDLRSNPGGAFQSAVEVASFFLPDDAIATYVVDNNDTKLPFKTNAQQRILSPHTDHVVLWIDGRSASASEVFAAALHDNCRAAVLGQKSFGKGLIQAVYGLKNGSGLVLTVAKYVTPRGTDIQGIGILPDRDQGVPPSLLGIVLSTDTSNVDFSYTPPLCPK